ncbi:hypothetical protein RE628_10915 [Paenibacillus sp. D2_2]|uniref:hypothetical protein n=1 Tax=Paenibacillus sp. D2_2 TaxID=3073092 RepID=UPI0028153882|nr:hypothetical protein [Paenibacillus sp. D2_2]WMT42754.1 hypothetical protein RE628_10915 [Paenibacillus sp. D2_2]
MEKLTEQTAAQIDWHVRDLIRKLGRGFDAWDARWEQQLDERLPQPEESWITDPVKEGAMLSGEYTLRYATEVATGIARSLQEGSPGHCRWAAEGAGAAIS